MEHRVDDGDARAGRPWEFRDVKLELTHPVRIFTIQYSAQLINRGECVVKDNRTAYELRKGRP